MKTIVYKVAILILVVLVSCGKEKKEDKKNDVEKEEVAVAGDVDLNLTDTKSQVVFTDETINSVYNQYLLVKGGLVNSNSKTVQQEAKKLNQLIKDTEANKQLKFVTLTTETEKLISQEAISSGEIYKQFCPMAFEGNGGYWLSDSKEVRNPYFGNSMLKCGEVKETIK